jgi:Lrp/AsnC family transcriptional regulator, leucine-responsive regulatory protein
MKQTVLMDQYGRNLLKALQSDVRASVAELSRRIGLSQTRTAERLKRLEESGVIQSYSVEIDREVLGLPILGFIRFTCSGGNYRKFLSFVKTLEQAEECHHTTGGDAFLLKVSVASMDDLEKLIESLLPFGDPTTSLVLSSPVSKRSLPISGATIVKQDSEAAL